MYHFKNNKTLSKAIALVAVVCMTFLSACKEEIDTSARYVFKELTIAGYLEKHEQFSEYVRLLKEQPVSEVSETSVYQLMTAYGYYTCFAPTNEAIQLYLDSLVIKGIIPEASWDAFPDTNTKDSIRSVLVLNSILDGTKENKTYMSAEFPTKAKEEFTINTMADRKISVSFDAKDNDLYLIDGMCPVSKTNRDIEAINGYIHELGYVINPSNETLGSTLHKFRGDKECNYSVMARLVEACGLIDTLTQVRDENYEHLYKIGNFPSFNWHYRSNPVNPPEHRKYGFTLFAETDDFWEKTLNKERQDISVKDIAEWVKAQNYYADATDDENYNNENNRLNQFVTYHILPLRIPVDKLGMHYNEKGYNFKTKGAKPTIPVWNHYVTMGKRRLLRIWQSLESVEPYLNRFPVLNNGRHDDYHEKECSAENEGICINTTDDNNGTVRLINAYIYPLDKPLAYTEEIRNNLAKTRLRYDVFEFAPESMNNDMRLVGVNDKLYYFSSKPGEQYFENITINTKETEFMLLTGWDCGWPNYLGDELLAEGIYDVTITLPPVPQQGTYEIRMGVSTASSTRGICQVYFGTKKDALVPQGIPVNMQLGGQDKLLGWELDTEDDDYNAEVDKKMRNNGFMKGPEYIVAQAGGRETNRANKASTRRIIVRETMRPEETYYLRFKTVQDNNQKQLFIDYLEWCPKEVYDNPETPEDIW